jgi:phage gp29-like protein
MSDNDPVIGAVLYAIEKVITRLEWRVDPFKDQSRDGDPDTTDIETATFVEECLNDMSDSWDSTLSQILSMCIYGWSFHEIVYKRRGGPDQKDPTKRSKFSDGKIGWRKWAIRGQETLYLWTFDDDGGIQGMQQVDPYTGHGRVDIPIEKALLFRTTAAKNNPEGRSLLRNAYRPWWFKRRIEEIEAIGIERDLAGLPIAYVPPEYLSSAATADQQVVLSAIKQIVTSIKRNENEGIVFPQVFDDTGKPLFDLKLLNSGGSRQFDTDKVITRLDQRIAMSVLSDFILLGQDRVGSFALGATKMDLWSMSVDSIAKTIADTVNQHAIPRLLRLNGMDSTRPPALQYSEVAHVDLAEIADFVSKMTTAGVLAPDPTLEDHLREIAGLPPANHNVEDTGTDVISAEDAKALMALPPQQRIVAERTGIVPERPAFPGANPPFGGGAPQQGGADEPEE